MNGHRILIFDSGIGGVTVARAVARQMPEAQLIYAADNAAFPYGAWDEHALVVRIVDVIRILIEKTKPDVAVIACNTASTIAMVALRKAFPIPFVGTVPAIKPAAAQTKSGVIGVLATPGTAKREYTQALIHTYAMHRHVILHGAPRLATMSEQALRGHGLDLQVLKDEVAPVFQTVDGRQTDVVVLGCTHYPLIADEIASVAPWPVAYIDPSAAIARRVGDVADETKRTETEREGLPCHGTVILTAGAGADTDTQVAYARMGFPHLQVVELPI
jgi:glutamate racemase